MTNNVIVDTRTDRSASLNNYDPTRNFFVRVIGDLGFQDANGGDYRLSTVSRYKGKASDGGDPGVNMDALNQALIGAR